MTLSPSAYIAARIRLDFSCALAIGSVYFIGFNKRPPITSTGGVPSAVVRMSAPISNNGTVTRRIGRLDKDSSPTSLDLNSCALSKPVIRRIDVPELPRSNSLAGSVSPYKPTPCIIKRPSWGPSIRTPISLNAFRVAKLSSPSRKPVISDVP